MIEAVLTIGAILTAINVVVNIVLVNKSSKESQSSYYPSFFLAIVGLLLVLVASLAPKVDLLGAGFGGWGIAALFAAAIGFVITSILDSYKNVNA
ncbi:hypothetical protein [Oceanobacillus massiliensis]|uniref:hypothetical protein n=1 Tax=Oceanobacillus massiliensis TaxID=1465765 RepID=UPI00028936B7|nr:hypothetical protein [Oceanobacillus massiliensis]